MTDEIKGAVAQALQENQSGNNISPQAYANRRMKQLQPEPQAEKSPEVEEEVIDTVQEEASIEPTEQPKIPESEEQEEEVETNQNTDEVLSQYNLDEMSEEDLKELAEKLGSRAVARFGELTAKRKQAEEELVRLKKSMQPNDKSFVKDEMKDNPYNDITSIEELQNKSKEVDEVIEWAEDALFNADGYAPDDVVTEVEGKQLTKAEIRNALLNA